jgi:hypothetical protein
MCVEELEYLLILLSSKREVATLVKEVGVLPFDFLRVDDVGWSCAHFGSHQVFIEVRVLGGVLGVEFLDLFGCVIDVPSIQKPNIIHKQHGGAAADELLERGVFLFVPVQRIDPI